MENKFWIYILTIAITFTSKCDKNPVKKNENMTSPVASFFVKPDSGTVDTVFTFDASNSSDTEDPDSSLKFRWDWEGDGEWDTDYLTQDTISHQYSQSGDYLVRLEVMDSGGLLDTASNSLVISEKKDSIVVCFLDQIDDAGTIVGSENDYLFLTKNNQLIINDISSSYIPSQLATIDFQSSVKAAVVFDDKLLVGTNSNGLTLFNISDIQNPTIIDGVPDLSVKSIKIANDKIGVCCSSSIRFYDFQFNYLGGYSISGVYFKDFVVNDNYLYTGELWEGVGNYLCEYDISDIGNINGCVYSQICDGITKLAICNNNLLVHDDAKVRLYNIDEPTNIVEKDYASLGWTSCMTVKDDTLFLFMNDTGGIGIYTISDSSTFTLKRRYNYAVYGVAAAVCNNCVYVNSYGSNDLFIFNYHKY